ncbi:unnamed protein product [Pseudo-nitzschia multistriata]|uniref:Uncharacterized protein n=1 Tax=Pseudo-nitzschia multistriata TaxID=183589 RepID=A0A448ZFF3_9STRA|nr:unnamed protein product [Pseudo-nitzschia multistriata]
MTALTTTNYNAILSIAVDTSDGECGPSVLAAGENCIGDDNYSECDSSYDAYDEICKQGEYLRMLRQLELEDEALREKERLENQLDDEGNEENDNHDNSSTLAYEKYLRNPEKKYDDYKHVNYQFIDFGVIASPHRCSSDENDNCHDNVHMEQNRPLTIEQDRNLGKGGFVWDSGVILAQSVLRMEARETDWLSNISHTCNKNKTKIIELGAGTGITSLLIASARPHTTVHLTDLPTLQPLLKKNCQRNCPERTTHGVLEWGKQPFGDDVDVPYDIILGADVVTGIYDSSGLAKTIYDLAHEKTVVYLALKDRLSGTIDRFESYMRELFRVIERKDADSDNKNPGVFILKISGKRIYC